MKDFLRICNSSTFCITCFKFCIIFTNSVVSDPAGRAGALHISYWKSNYASGSPDAYP